ncbi:hypothetical protein ROHU_021965 [Labeo rohita]|uniref:Reverse transcriptase n=1 Tax=Labeo rohita TaxID=84645 RepID=A0A498N7E1_LABRO|nr:hypothetical protein ROHU_021965 [Labeo rohita]
MEEESYRIKAVSQCQQGKWTTWEAVIGRTITWADLWKLSQTRLSFLIRATYDTLPSPQNLHRWYGTEELCQLCGHQSPSLQHILSGCKTALTQGRYRWRHDRVLRKLAEVIEGRRLEVNKASSLTSDQPVQFVREGGEALCSIIRERSLLSPGGEWDLRVDISHQLKFPQQIAITSLRPDIVIWSTTTKSVIMAELTVPWEDGIEAAFERKKEKYADLAAACTQAGWRAYTFPVEVGCRGFTGTSTQRFLKTLGVRGHKLQKALKDLAEEAEQGSFWLWLRRKDKAWGRDGS